MRAGSPSTSIGVRRSPRSATQPSIRFAGTRPRDSQLRKPLAGRRSVGRRCRRRRAIGAATSGSGTPAQRRDRLIGTHERDAAAGLRPEAQVALPRDRLEERAPAGAERRRRCARARRGGVTAAISSSRVRVRPSSASRTAVAEAFHGRRGHAEVALPDRPLPGPPAASSDRNAPGVLRREQVERAAHRPGLDEPPVGAGHGRRRRPRLACAARGSPSSADEATWAWTPLSRRTSSASARRPIGSSSCRRIRHARACRPAHVHHDGATGAVGCSRTRSRSGP